jgi:competence protein ComEA
MRNRSHDQRVAEVTRRRLEALAAELGMQVDEPGPPDTVALQDRPADVDAVPRPGRHARRPVAGPRRVALWASDRLPTGARPRLDLGAAHVGLVALVLAVGLLSTAWFVTRSSSGTAVPPRVSPPAASSSGPSIGSPSGSSDGATVGASGAPSPSARLVVDVVGRVRRPGIAVLPSGARVVDAIKAAGGARPGVDLSGLNLARLLTDGEQIAVGRPAGAAVAAPPPAGTPGTAAPTALVNLNTADQAALESLPGVGPVTAAAILQWRAEHGAFSAVEELLEVSGIGDATLAEIRPHVTL